MLGIHVISPFYTRPDQWERESERKRERERVVSAELSLSSVSLFQEGIINQRAADMWRENTRRQKKFSRRRPRYGPGQQIKEGGGRKKRKRSGLHEKKQLLPQTQAEQSGCRSRCSCAGFYKKGKKIKNSARRKSGEKLTGDNVWILLRCEQGNTVRSPSPFNALPRLSSGDNFNCLVWVSAACDRAARVVSPPADCCTAPFSLFC